MTKFFHSKRVVCSVCSKSLKFYHETIIRSYNTFILKFHDFTLQNSSNHSLIEPHLFHCTPAGGYKFHTLAVQPHHTLTTTSIGSTFEIWSNICGGAFLRKEITFLSRWLFSQESSIMDVSLDLHQTQKQDEILDSARVLISLSNTRNKNIKNPSTRQIRLTHVTNSQAVAYKSLRARYSPRATGFYLNQ